MAVHSLFSGDKVAINTVRDIYLGNCYVSITRALQNKRSSVNCVGLLASERERVPKVTNKEGWRHALESHDYCIGEKLILLVCCNFLQASVP